MVVRLRGHFVPRLRGRVDACVHPVWRRRRRWGRVVGLRADFVPLGLRVCREISADALSHVRRRRVAAPRTCMHLHVRRVRVGVVHLHVRVIELRRGRRLRIKRRGDERRGVEGSEAVLRKPVHVDGLEDLPLRREFVPDLVVAVEGLSEDVVPELREERPRRVPARVIRSHR